MKYDFITLLKRARRAKESFKPRTRLTYVTDRVFYYTTLYFCGQYKTMGSESMQDRKRILEHSMDPTFEY